MKPGRSCWLSVPCLFLSLSITPNVTQSQTRTDLPAATFIQDLRESAPYSGKTPASVRGVQWIKQDRGAVYNQPGEHIRVEVKWNSGTPITGMRITTGYETYLQLHDDGSHSDEAAGDGVWSLDSIAVNTLTGTPAYRIVKDSKYGCANDRWLPVEWQLTDGTWENDGYAYVRLGFVDPLFTVDVQELGPGVWATEYCLFIEDSLQSERTFPGYPVTDKSWSYLMKPASAILYAHLPDAFDFLVVTPATPIWLPNPVLLERVPNASAIKNDVQGIGMTAFDHTAEWGSSGKLQAVVYYSYGPFNMLSHEMGHRWMAYLDSLTFSNGACGVHWAEDQTIGGNMSLWPKIIETAPGVFRGVTHHTPDAFNATYSDLDLYLMGLKPLSEVPIIKRLNDADFTNPDTVLYSSITTIDPTTLPARYGARQPTYPDAQKDFTMATIVVKPLGWTDAEFAYFSLLARHAADTLDDGYGYNYNFEKAARGSASLESRMFSPSKVPLVPVLSSPANGATGEPALVTLAWEPSQSATSYALQVSKRPDFTDTLKVKSGITGTSDALSDLVNGTTYYWRVCAIGDNGKSRFSAPWTFTVGTSTSADDREGETVREFALQECFPNPFNPATTVWYDVPYRSQVLLSVYNVLGQRIATLVNAEVEPGRHMTVFEESELTSGMYFCRMEAVDLSGEEGKRYVQTRRMMLLK